jgi:prolyl-tRNA synthetase
MRWTQTLIPTQKQDPTDAVIASHKLLVRGGFIRQLAAGTYTLLPLGLRSLQKAQQIVREEMNAAGAAEILMPALQPMELWQQTGRDQTYGDNLMTLTDRHGRGNVLGPTHEEVITSLVRDTINSYKQLPLNLYQIQTKFRDEFRPRFGLLRVREFLMKDAYSFDRDEAGLDTVYDLMYAAYERIFQRCGVPVDIVEAESGPIGGSASHEFMAPCSVGEDVIVRSDKGNYAANVEKAEIGDRDWTFDGDPTGELEEVHTPGMSTIEEVGKFMKVKPKNMLKTLVFKRTDGEGFVLAVVRGDHEVNEAKLRQATGLELELDEAAAKAAGFAIGYVSPAAAVGRNDTRLLIDPDAAQGGFWATGANKPDHHVKHFNWQRDLVKPHARHDREEVRPAQPASTSAGPGDAGFAGRTPSRSCLACDIRNAAAGDPSPKNDGGVLSEVRGIELGHVFKLGTRYSDALDAQYLGEDGQRHPIQMGCYGIGVGRILIAAAEQFHDDRGLMWPAAIAPFSVVVTPIKYEGEMKTVAERLYLDLTAAGVDVLLDDRDDRPGPKFADADLIGIPLRITVGDRGLKENVVEFKKRGDKDSVNVPVDDAVQTAAHLLNPDTLPNVPLSA